MFDAQIAFEGYTVFLLISAKICNMLQQSKHRVRQPKTNFMFIFKLLLRPLPEKTLMLGTLHGQIFIGSLFCYSSKLVLKQKKL